MKRNPHTPDEKAKLVPTATNSAARTEGWHPASKTSS